MNALKYNPEMKHRHTLTSLMVGALLIALPLQAKAGENGAAPVGFQIMCLRNPEQCQGGGSSAVKASQSVLKHLDRVNRAVNRSIKPRSDGAADRWTTGASSGDCEDYVLAKRQRLVADGFAPSALRIAYVNAPSGEGHAVLIVRTDKGDYVLDNLAQSVRKVGATGYQVRTMSGADPLVWN